MLFKEEKTISNFLGAPFAHNIYAIEKTKISFIILVTFQSGIVYLFVHIYAIEETKDTFK